MGRDRGGSPSGSSPRRWRPIKRAERPPARHPNAATSSPARQTPRVAAAPTGRNLPSFARPSSPSQSPTGPAAQQQHVTALVAARPCPARRRPSAAVGRCAASPARNFRAKTNIKKIKTFRAKIPPRPTLPANCVWRESFLGDGAAAAAASGARPRPSAPVSARQRPPRATGHLGEGGQDTRRQSTSAESTVRTRWVAG